MTYSLLNNRTLILKRFLLALFFIILSVDSFAQVKSPFIRYIHPKPGAEYITPQSSILIKINADYKKELRPGDFQFIVEGEKSGSHNGEIVISDNTIIYKPTSIFKTSENVFVSISARNHDWNDTLNFSFTTSSIRELFRCKYICTQVYGVWGSYSCSSIYHSIL